MDQVILKVYILNPTISANLHPVSPSKGGQRRTVHLNQRLRKALADYAISKCLRELNRPLFESQKSGHFLANTMCHLVLDIYWTCPTYVLVSHLIYAAFRSNAKGLLSPSDEWRRRGL